MPEEIKKADIIKWLVRSLTSVAVAFAVFAYGIMIGRIERVEIVAKDAQTRVSAVEGDIREIKTNVEWLKMMRDKYERANGQFNMEKFLEELFTKK